MRNIINILLCSLATILFSCTMDKIVESDGGNEEVGYLSLEGVSYTTDTDNITVSSVTRSQAPADDSYYVEVYEKYTETLVWSGTYASLKEAGQPKPIALVPGIYYATARQTESGAINGCAIDAPYYSGRSADIVITKKNTTSSRIDCYLANILTTVELSADLKHVFKSLPSSDSNRLKTTVKVGTESEANTYDFESSSTHAAPKVYFKDIAGAASQDGNTMTITLTGKFYTGYAEDIGTSREDETLYKQVSMTKNITNVRAKQWRKISIDIDHSTTGNVQFVITIESYTYDDEMYVDVMTLYSNLNTEEKIEDPEHGGDEEEEDENAPSAMFEDGSLQFTFSQDDYDEDEEMWLKNLVAIIAPKEGSTLVSAYAQVSSESQEFMQNLAANVQMPDNKVSLYPTNGLSTYMNFAEDGNNKKFTAKKSSLTKLSGYTGTHTFSIYTEDNLGRKKHTDLKISFGSSAGGDLSVEWYAGQTEASTKTNSWTIPVDGSAAVEARINATKGLTGLSVVITSDKLSKETLEEIGLSQTMDLFNPKDAEMENILRNLGFLPKAEGKQGTDDDEYRMFDPQTGERRPGKECPYKDMTELTFSITEFMPLLSMLGQSDSTFELAISDNSSATTKGSMRIIVK